ncbi:LpqN/LpqT family lipoprotein [Nocardia sp. NPDC052566]|uniref:LpqN/LpqT family lipoprotein n=1 Tax=Nocardia sp. NPDC052566 TaxID=3364330 RepID=UPI0037C87FBE
MSIGTIYEALGSVAISSHRVTNPRSIPGAVVIELDPDAWEELSGESSGYLRVYGLKSAEQSGFRSNVVVVLTRVIVNNGVDLADLVEHAFVDARRLPGWREEQAQVWPAANRHSGWSVQAGLYQSGEQSLYTVTQYAVYQRANVGYLLQATGTTAEADRSRYGSLIDKVVRSVNFED